MGLLETTAGQGTTLGHRFEHLARILDTVATPGRLGVCLDTCHVFAAGYSFATEREYAAMMDEFDRVIGLKRLKLFHLNDSKKPLGSRVDRHAHIGQGHVGLEAFRLLVNDRRFRRHPMILETPKEGPNKDQTLKGIYELKKGVLKVCVAKPDGERPKRAPRTCPSPFPTPSPSPPGPSRDSR